MFFFFNKYCQCTSLNVTESVKFKNSQKNRQIEISKYTNQIVRLTCTKVRVRKFIRMYAGLSLPSRNIYVLISEEFSNWTKNIKLLILLKLLHVS